MPSFKIIGLLVLEKEILNVFNIYGRGVNLGHVTLTIYIYFRFPFPRRLHVKYGVECQGDSEEKMLEIVDDDDNDNDNRCRSMDVLLGHLVSPMYHATKLKYSSCKLIQT